MDNQTKIEVLGARAYAYQVLHSLFGTHPTEAQLSVLRDPITREAFEVVGSSEAYRAAVDAFLAAIPTEFSDDLESEYTRLFEGPGELRAAPWESVYRSNQRLVFTEETIEVRKAYLAQGYIPRQFPHMPDDHVSLECDFMNRLAIRASEDLYAGNAMGSDKAQADSLAFLKAHLGLWASAYADAMNGGEEVFYPAAAKLLAEFVREDIKLLESLA